MAESLDVDAMLAAVPRPGPRRAQPPAAAGGRRGAHPLHRAGPGRLPGLRHHRRRRRRRRGRRARAPDRPAPRRAAEPWPTAASSAAIAAIDAANADDPNTIEVRGEVRPKEQAHAELMTEWVDAPRPRRHRRAAPRRPGPPPAPLEPARGRLPGGPGRLPALAHRAARSSTPTRWRRSSPTSATTPPRSTRVQRIIRKEGLGTDPQVQIHEDALCLVFLETQLAELGRRPGRREDGRRHPEDRRQDEPDGALELGGRPPDARRATGRCSPALR